MNNEEEIAKLCTIADTNWALIDNLFDKLASINELNKLINIVVKQDKESFFKMVEERGVLSQAARLLASTAICEWNYRYLLKIKEMKELE